MLLVGFSLSSFKSRRAPLFGTIAIVETDLRRRAVWVTETGARRLEAAIPVWRKAHAALAKRLSPALARRLADEAAALVRD